MRLTLFVFLLGIVQVFALDSYSQQTKLNLEMKNTKLGTVLNEIENQSEFYFLFNEEMVDMERRVSASFRGKVITEVLNVLFEDTDVKYVISDRQIVLSANNYEFGSNSTQERKITGLVTDGEGAPLPGVTVFVKETTTGTVTDIDGEFILDVPSGKDVLVISFIGMKSQEIAIGNQSRINVRLMADVIGLEEVVAIGYGSVRKSDLTGAVSQVNAVNMENENPNDVTDLLRANIAGLSVGLDNSAKGVGSLQIRGKGTLNAGSSPLIVLDGTIYYGDLSDINPNDIATVDVLKDASSTAIYGSRAANGVILISTKKGKKGKSLINVNSSVGFAELAMNRDVYDGEGYVKWRQDVMRGIYVSREKQYFNSPDELSGITIEEWKAYDGAQGDPTDIWLNRLSMQSMEIENYKAGNSINWYDRIFQTGFRQDHNVSLSGQKDDFKYYWSLGYMNNEGVVYGDEFSVLRSRVNLEADVTDFFAVGVNAQFSTRDESAVKVWEGSAPLLSPLGSEFNDDGTYRESPQDDPGSGAINPFLEHLYRDQQTITNSLYATMFAKIKLPLGFTYEVNFNNNIEWYNKFRHDSSENPRWANIGGRSFRTNSKGINWQVDNILRWNKTIDDDHKFDVTFLANAEKFKSWYSRMDNRGYDPNDALGYHAIGAGTSPVISSDDVVTSADALMGRLMYSYKSKYLLTASVRRDGYSAFGKNNARATFPSFALAWVISEEDFFQSDKIDYLKLRTSWGVNGNRGLLTIDRTSNESLSSAETEKRRNSEYAALSALQAGKYLYSNGGTAYTSARLSAASMENSDLKWEKTTSTNIGLDFAAFDNTVSGSIDVYSKTANDLLVQRSLPDVTGYSWVWSNLGELQNKGIELNIQTRNLKKENIEWTSSFNFSLNRNEIKSLYGDLDENGNELDDIRNEWFIGHDINAIWGLKTNGVYQLGDEAEADRYGVYPGDFRVVDVNDDGKYTDDDKMFLGFEDPRYRWTLRNDFKFLKNFEASFMVYSQWGHLGVDNSGRNGGFLDRTSSYVIPYWTEDNPINDAGRLYSSSGGASYDLYRDRSFIRLQNISFAYHVPKSTLNKYHIENLKVYLNVKNVGVYSKDWITWDPETREYSPRVYTLGVSLTL